MNATDALARLKRMVQDDVEPTLSDDDLNDLLSLAAVVDADDRRPDNDAWEPTYSVIFLNASAAEGWMVKAGKLSAGETFSSDGASFNPEVRIRSCLDLAERYRKRVVGTNNTPGRTAQSPAALLYEETLLN